jgi:hypothetical protein
MHKTMHSSVAAGPSFSYDSSLTQRPRPIQRDHLPDSPILLSSSLPGTNLGDQRTPL